MFRIFCIFYIIIVENVQFIFSSNKKNKSNLKFWYINNYSIAIFTKYIELNIKILYYAPVFTLSDKYYFDLFY